jgi:hypothetical protein
MPPLLDQMDLDSIQVSVHREELQLVDLRELPGSVW